LFTYRAYHFSNPTVQLLYQGKRYFTISSFFWLFTDGRFLGLALYGHRAKTAISFVIAVGIGTVASGKEEEDVVG
jgi:hypothetical protein